jgi:hypothetical protein
MEPAEHRRKYLPEGKEPKEGILEREVTLGV